MAALPKQSVQLTFGQGLDLKTDPFQVSPGKFLSLHNSVFNKGGLLQKRNGYGSLTPLPDTSNTYLTTFNGNLTAIGTSINALSTGLGKWVDKGDIQPVKLSTLPLIRSNTNQIQSDTAIAPNGLVCTVFTDNVPVAGMVTAEYKYAIADSITGQNIIAPTIITPSVGVVAGSPRVFLLKQYFIIAFTVNVTGTYHIQYIAISITDPTSVTTAQDITATYTPSSTVAWDAVEANNILYFAWNGSDFGGAIRIAGLSASLALSINTVFNGVAATIMSMSADISNSTAVIYASFYDSGSSTGHTLAVSQNLGVVLNPVLTIASGTVNNITSVATNSVCTIFYEVDNVYSYDGTINTNYIKKNTITQAGTVGTASIIRRSVGLASKAIIVDNKSYFLSVYASDFQPTYFLLDDNGNIISKLAYSNAGGYYTLGLPNVSLSDTTIKFSYLIKDLIAAVNKTMGDSAAGIYSQTGINLASVTVTINNISSAEIADDLNLSGGYLSMYDGYSIVEQGFFVWPDDVEVTTDGGGGSGFIAAQTYFYQALYEWTDNQGNIFRSAPSLPVEILVSAGTSTNTINVPTLRLTYKTANPVKIVLFRWSTAQQEFFQVTSIANPILNDPTVDSIAIVDTLADASILGNSLIYTTGGVLENIGPPATDSVTLFDTRLWLIDAEDRNLLWFSKQVIEATPVEMSDLLTKFVPPTTGVNGSTGFLQCLSAMDDKLILFKKDAIYYINGSGPDNTGANDQYSQATFITATVGCENQQSIVFQPQGLMFQSDKGIWILGRDLQTSYIGAPVESLTQGANVMSAVNVPETNQVRFTLDSGITLMYDYYFGQWGSFVNVPAVSSTIYQGLHTYINAAGAVFQETPGKYLDGSNAVLMSFTTSWFNMAGLQGFERAYFFYLLGMYYTPHKLNVQIAYDYNPNPVQSSLITPVNFNPNYGSEPGFYGSGSPYGGNGSVEQWRVFLRKQKCQSFQIQLSEIFDPSLGTQSGQGLSLSGLDLVIGTKKGYPSRRSSLNVG